MSGRQGEVEVTIDMEEEKGFLGSFGTKAFWRGLAKLIIRETIYAFITHLGGSLVHYANNKLGPESRGVRKLVTGGEGFSEVTPEYSPSSMAFSAGPQRNSYTQYKPQYPPPKMEEESLYPFNR